MIIIGPFSAVMFSFFFLSSFILCNVFSSSYLLLLLLFFFFIIPPFLIGFLLGHKARPKVAVGQHCVEDRI